MPHGFTFKTIYFLKRNGAKNSSIVVNKINSIEDNEIENGNQQMKIG